MARCQRGFVRFAAAVLPLVSLLCLVGPARSQEPVQAPEGEELQLTDLRERLTEREDENRVEDPWSTMLGGYPLTVAGELETYFGYVEELSLGDPDGDYDRLLLEENLQFEIFYSLGTPLSVFAQFDVAVERDLHTQTPDRVSDVFMERGEMWVYSEDIAGSGLHLEVGSLDFEDDRLWWWDADLDAVRVAYETETFELALAVARELLPRRSDHSHIEPEQEDVMRLIGEASWDWDANQAVEAFALHQNDRSGTDPPGTVVRRCREDESDAKLTWIGVRAVGAMASRSRGILGYWIDTAFVWGSEEVIDFEELTPETSRVDDLVRRKVRGWAIDAGVNWMPPSPLEPRLFAGYAIGSGDDNAETDTDRSFRQTGIHENESGFGGVQRFGHYGALLDPELSNLSVGTVGLGLSLLDSSSLDLVYHYYRLVEPAAGLRDARLDPELDGSDRDVGHGLDIVLALEEWDRLELEVSGSVFRAGRAFVADRRKWTYGGFFALRIAF
jgi:hypothetical protein